MQPSKAHFKHQSLKNCSLGWNQQLSWYFCSLNTPFAVLQLRVTSPLKNGFQDVLSNFTNINPPIVQTTFLCIQSSEGNEDFILLTVQLLEVYLKLLLYSTTKSESGAPNTSNLRRSSEEIEIEMSQAKGKNPKSKVQKTYFLISPSLTAQKQLNPFTFLSLQQTSDWKTVDIPTTVRLIPSQTEALCINSFQCSKLLSSTSVSIITLFQQFIHSFYFTKLHNSFFDKSKPLLIVVPPPVCTSSSKEKRFQGSLSLNVGSSSTLPTVVKVTIPTESFGLSLEMNIFIAYTDNFSLERSFFLYSPSPPPIDPDVSRLITALIGVSSLSAPSFELFMKIARQSLILESN